VEVALDGQVSSISVSVPAGTTQRVSLDGKDMPGLHLKNPRLWWPVGYGAPELYTLQVRAKAGDDLSDARTIRFGVREVTSDLTSDGYRRYLVNRRPILIRGAGWARDLFFMESAKREEQEMRLVVDMGLNAVRFEGKLGSDHLLDLADEKGVFVIAGFCCCDCWEHWGEWSAATKTIAIASFRLGLAQPGELVRAVRALRRGMDAQQRLAVAGVAPLRLLPRARQRLLRNQEIA
jgi:exo-1,4-beta-D-glucosaminidase